MKVAAVQMRARLANLRFNMDHADGEGVVSADIDIRQKHLVSESIPDGFWIPDLPAQFKLIWALQNWHGKRYFRGKNR